MVSGDLSSFILSISCPFDIFEMHCPQAKDKGLFDNTKPRHAQEFLMITLVILGGGKALCFPIILKTM